MHAIPTSLGRPTGIAFLYLGRRGPIAQLMVQLGDDLADSAAIDPTFIVANSSESAARMARFGDQVLKLDTHTARPLPFVTNFPGARRTLLRALSRNPPHAVVTLMPHIWTPLLAPGIKKLGIPYITILHDVVSHPGDPTARLTPWLLRDAKVADLVITLSQSVADQLSALRLVSPDRIVSLFLPDLKYSNISTMRTRIGENAAPLRLLFFGRIMEYKGLPLLTSAIEMLRADGFEISLGVAGSGFVDNDLRDRLNCLNAELINRWIAAEEVSSLLARYDAVVLSHTEASQSGVAATAFGAGMPVVGMPVGGIAEQIEDGRTGVLAEGFDARSLANAIHRLATDEVLYNDICHYLAATASNRSAGKFAGGLLQHVLQMHDRRRT